jgi:ABC-type transport system involved in multi-copper enzyme maturation permease subunit
LPAAETDCLLADVTFLPIVERELRVAARKRSTFWVRVAAALVALVIGSGFLALSAVGYWLGPFSLGKALFGALTWLSLAVALSAGLFFTSDCLSEEKREGTIGLLFLTDLRGYDVVLGKLLATSLRGACALLAVFPVLALTLLMGGVSGAQFWQTVLALVNALMISLAAGLLASALSRDSQKAQVATLLWLVVLVGGGPAGDGIYAVAHQRGFIPVLSLASPGFLFLEAGAWGQTSFWPGLLANQAVAWTLFGAACLLLPHAWQERGAKRATGESRWAYAVRFGGGRRRARLRRRLLDPNPALWLACRERWQALVMWALMLGVVGTFVGVLLSDDAALLWTMWSFLATVIGLAWYLAVASQAARFFVEARRNGLIELLLATPLTATQVVHGHWGGMLRMFAIPLALCVAAQALGGWLSQEMTWNMMATAAPPAGAPPLPAVTSAATGTAATNTMPSGAGVASTTPPPLTITNVTVITVTNAAGVVTTIPFGGFTPPPRAVTLAMSASNVVTSLMNLAALAWFGMWMGMTSRTTNLATLKTIAFVQIIPWVVIGFAAMLVVPLVLMPRFARGGTVAVSQTMLWFPFLMSAVTFVLSLAKDVAFLVWARRRLNSEFRERVVQALMPVRVAPPPAPRGAAPPVIAAK